MKRFWFILLFTIGGLCMTLSLTAHAYAPPNYVYGSAMAADNQVEVQVSLVNNIRRAYIIAIDQEYGKSMMDPEDLVRYVRFNVETVVQKYVDAGLIDDEQVECEVVDHAIAPAIQIYIHEPHFSITPTAHVLIEPEDWLRWLVRTSR